MTGLLKTEIDALVAANEAQLIDLDMRKQGGKLHLEVFVDTESGITADELATISRNLGKSIADNDLVNEAYTLVVSSPGLDRPLRFPWQYRRHTGRRLLVTYRKAESTVTSEGTIHDVSDEQIVIKDEENMTAIPFEVIEHARIQATL